MTEIIGNIPGNPGEAAAVPTGPPKIPGPRTIDRPDNLSPPPSEPTTARRPKRRRLLAVAGSTAAAVAAGALVWSANSPSEIEGEAVAAYTLPPICPEQTSAVIGDGRFANGRVVNEASTAITTATIAGILGVSEGQIVACGKSTNLTSPGPNIPEYATAAMWVDKPASTTATIFVTQNRTTVGGVTHDFYAEWNPQQDPHNLCPERAFAYPTPRGEYVGRIACFGERPEEPVSMGIVSGAVQTPDGLDVWLIVEGYPGSGNLSAQKTLAMANRMQAFLPDIVEDLTAPR